MHAAAAAGDHSRGGGLCGAPGALQAQPQPNQVHAGREQADPGEHTGHLCPAHTAPAEWHRADHAPGPDPPHLDVARHR